MEKKRERQEMIGRMKGIVTKKNIIQLVIVILIASVLFSNIAINYRSFDTYRIETTQGLENYAMENSFNDGRIFMGLISMAAAKINIDVQVLVTLNIILAIVILGCCTIYLKNIIVKFTKKENMDIVFLTLSFLFFFNFMMIDSMQFLENIVISMSILLYTISAKKLVLDQKKSVSLFLGILGMFFYQATICCFLQLVLFFELVTNKKIKNILYSIGISLIAIASNYVYIKIYESFFNYKLIRISSDIFSNIANIFKSCNDLIIRSAGFLYDYVWILFILVVLLLIILYNLKKSQNHKNIISIMSIFLYSTIIPISTMIVSKLDYYGSGRIFFSVGSVIPIILIYILVTTDIYKEKILKYIFLTITITYFIINAINIYQICYSFKRVNEFDKQVCDQIIHSIEKYEKENNKTVTGMAIMYSHNKEWDIFNQKIRPVAIPRSFILCGLPIRTITKLYYNREFDNVFYEEEDYKKYFDEKELEKDFSEKNVECVNDIAYVYI